LVASNGIIPTVVGPMPQTKQNFLMTGLSTEPLANGAAGNYWVEIHVNGLSELPAGTHIFITFHDVYNRYTTNDYMWEPGS
jgi:hypothetical protein